MAIPTFSIILPTYNRASLLTEAIQSVLNQQYTDFELVIINDGSVDNTASVIKNIDDSRIKYYFQENKGKGASRNVGLAKSQGRNICFLDDDDLYNSNHLSTFYDYIMSNPEKNGVLRTGVTSQISGEKFESKYYNGKSLSDQIDFVLTRYFCLLDLCIPNHIANQVTFPNYSLWQDKYYILLLLSKHKLHQITERTVIAREHSDRSVNKAYKDLEVIKEQALALHTLKEKINLSVPSLDNTFMKTEQRILSTHIYNALQYGGLKEGLKISLKFIKDKDLKISTTKIIKTWFKFYI